MTTLVIAEHDHGALKSATLHTIAAAQKVGGDIHVLVAGHNAGGAAAAAAAQVAGVAKVLHADAPHFATPDRGEPRGAGDRRWRASYSHLFLPATGFGKNVGTAHRGAARCRAGLRHHRRRVTGHVRAARSTRATRLPPCRRRTRKSSSPCARPASTRRPRSRRQRDGRERRRHRPDTAQVAGSRPGADQIRIARS